MTPEIDWDEAKRYYQHWNQGDRWYPLNQGHLEEVLKLKPKLALDFGCGTGKMLAAMKLKGIEVVGIDVSDVGVAKAQEKGLDVSRGDESSLVNFPDGWFDVVTTCSVLDHVMPDRVDDVVKELQRVGDAVVIMETNTTKEQGPHFMFNHDYSQWGFVKTGESWVHTSDENRYDLWKWVR